MPEATIPDLRQYDQFEATYTPRRTDDLKPDSRAKEWIGKRGTWEASWLIDEDQGGPYVGEFACWTPDPPDTGPFGWSPSGDFTDIVILSRLNV